MTTNEVAEMLRACGATVYNHRLELGAFKVGRNLRFRRSSVLAYMALMPSPDIGGSHNLVRCTQQNLLR